MNHAQDGLKSRLSRAEAADRTAAATLSAGNPYWELPVRTSIWAYLGSSQTDCPEVSLEGKTWGDIGKISERYREEGYLGISRNISRTCRYLQKHPKWSLRHTLSNQTLRRFRSHFWRFLPDLCRLGWHVSWTQVMSVGSDIFCGSTRHIVLSI